MTDDEFIAALRRNRAVIRELASPDVYGPVKTPIVPTEMAVWEVADLIKGETKKEETSEP